MTEGTPMLGRESSLQALDTALAQAAGGRGSLAVIWGDAGIGKSRLLAELGLRGEARGFNQARGRAWEFADAPPWFPVRACLRSIGVDVDSELDRGRDDFSLWERVLEGLALSTRDTPALWLLEDLHAADLQTLDLLTFLALPVSGLRAAVVVTTRSSDPRLTDPMRERLTRMARDGVDVRLGSLTVQQVGALVEHIAGTRVEPDLIDELMRLSEGNPLFVHEYARALRAAHGVPGALRGALRSVPPTLRQVVSERAHRLPEATQQALQVGAAIGRDFSAARLARVMDLSPAGVIDSLLAALSAGLVIEGQPGQFRFSHVLVRDALYETTPPGERAQLHSRAAMVLNDARTSLDARIARAHHALLGLPLAEPDMVLEVVTGVVEELRAQRAFDRAHNLNARLDQARADGLIDAATAAQVLDSAQLALAAGRFAESRALCERVVAIARERGDADLLGRAALQQGAALRPGYVDASLVGALREAGTAVGTSDAALSCLLLARLSAALQPAPDPLEPVKMAFEAIAAARKVGDRDHLKEVLYYAGSALVDYAPVAQRLPIARELLELAEDSQDGPRALTACARIAVDSFSLGDVDGFSAAVDRALQISAELGYAPPHRWRPVLMASMRAAAQGRFEACEQLLAEAHQLARHCDDPALTMSLCSHEYCLRRLQRREDTLSDIVTRLEVLTAESPMGPALGGLFRAALAARRGDAEGTQRELEMLVPFMNLLEKDVDFALTLGEPVALAGSESMRTRLLGLLESFPTSDACMGHILIFYDGPMLRLRGLLEASLGHDQLAQRHLRAALETAIARGHRPWVAQIAFELGKLMMRLGDVEQATILLDQAIEGAEQLPMPGLLRDARAQLRRRPATDSSPTAEAEPVARPLAFTRTGDAWQVTWGPSRLSVRHTRGVELLARLVERAPEEIHVLALQADGAMGSESDAGAHLDETALRAYRARLAELDAEIDEAESIADLGRLERLRHEREQLVAELSRAVGLGGRVRKAGSTTERARVNVRKRLADAVERIRALDPDLGRYLSQGLRTGAFCSFRPA